MKGAARTWLTTFAVGFAIVSVMLVVTLFTPAPYGDLTRIGRVSDADYGWHAPPPPAPTGALHGVPVKDADILVVGDSFSMTLYWQSALVQAGYRVATIYWGQFGYLCKDFSAWATSAGFKGQAVIVESVERLLDERLREGAKCNTMLKEPVAKREPFMKTFTAVPPNTLNWSARLNAGFITWRNTRRARLAKGDTFVGHETVVRRVPDGCKQFSNRLCDRVPFYKEDVDNGPLTLQDFELIKRFDASQPMNFIWMVIPNKTTVYIEHDNSKAFVQAFRESGLGPDLFAFADHERTRVRDFYFPNDTHMSMHGQLAMGQIMLQAVRQRVGPPPLAAR